MMQSLKLSIMSLTLMATSAAALAAVDLSRRARN